jgi:hypothetical protein
MAAIFQAFSENRRQFMQNANPTLNNIKTAQTIENLISENHFTTTDDNRSNLHEPSRLLGKDHLDLNNTGEWGGKALQNGIQYFVRENANSINMDEVVNVLSDEEILQVYHFSLEKLKALYKDHFLHSDDCKHLILELNNSIIEFRFLQMAGFINPN